METLNRVAPHWSLTIRAVGHVGDYVAVTVAITIAGATREGIGVRKATGDQAIVEAESDALLHAARRFGISPDSRSSEDGSAQSRPRFPRDPVARSMNDLVTPRQLGIIRTLGRATRRDAEKECVRLMRCRTDELSRTAASSLIDYLERLRTTSRLQVRRAS